MQNNTQVDYRDLFHKVWALLSSPADAWKDVENDSSTDDILTTFLYPLIGICACVEFINIFIHQGFERSLLQVALIQSTSVAIALFGGFFLAVFLIEKIASRFYGHIPTHQQIQIFVGYSMVVILVLSILKVVITIILLHWLLKLYTIYIIFEGLRNYIKLDEDKLLWATVSSSVAILASPTIIGFIFNKLSVLLN